jgi:hypothetical protein
MSCVAHTGTERLEKQMKNSMGKWSDSLRAALVMGAVAIGATACGSSDTEGTLEDPEVVAKLHELALRASSADGASPPTSMYAVAVSDHQAAETVLSGAIIFDHAPVFVIVIIGGPFTGRSAPPGVPLPVGTVLTLTVDAASYEITDAGIGDVEPDLSKVASAFVDLSAE